MNRTVAIAMIHLIACLTAVGQTTPVQAQPQFPAKARDDRSQSGSTSEGTPTFHSAARLVLITAGVWKRTADKQPDESLVPTDILRRYPPEFLGPWLRYAKKLDTRLTQSDFHAFDNGAEQHISYFKKTVVPLKDETKEERISWRFFPTIHGTWGHPPGFFFPTHESAPPPPGYPPPGRYAFAGGDITYVIGYVPPALEPGKCRDVRMEVENHDVGLDRNQYCAVASSHDIDEATKEGTDVGTKIRTFADSEASGSIKVSARAFAFWSSRVWSLVTQNAAGESTAPAGSDLSFAVEARTVPKAPARVHVAVEFVPTGNGWTVNCGQKTAALHVLGIAYKENHQIAGQLGETFTCPRSELAKKRIEISMNGSREYNVAFPSRLDAEMDLGPGDYDLRVVVSNGDKEFGTTRVPLHVESFDGQQLATSDVVLSSFPRDSSKALDDAAAVSPAPLVPAPLISKNVQFLPDTETRMPRHMRLPLYFEIYEPLLRQQATEVYMHLRVTNLKTGSVVLDSGQTSAANWVLPGSPVIPVGFSLGTQNLDKGNYRVDVQATDAAGRASAWRQANFTID
jgi:hypothetical protein